MTDNSKRTEVVLAYKTDTQSVNKAIADAKSLSTDLAKTSSSGILSDKKSDVIARESSRYEAELANIAESQRKRLIEEAKLLGMSADKLQERIRVLELEQRANQEAIAILRASGDTSDKTAKKIEQYEKANEELGKTLNFIASNALPNASNALTETALSAQDSYDRVNKNVALAGDVASNAAQVGGALRALGADFAGDALEGFVVLGDLTEGLPRLKEAVKGLPQSLATLVSTIGVGGFGLIGAVGLGVVAFGELSKSLDEARKQGEEYAQSLIDIADTLASAEVSLARGDVDTAIQQLISAQEKRNELTFKQARLEQDIADLQAQRLQRSSGQLGILDQLADRFDPVIQQIDGAISVLQTSLDETSVDITESAQTVNELVSTLNDYGLTNEEIINEMARLNTTTQKVTETVNELNTVLLSQADVTRNRYLQEISLLYQSQEALQERQKQINAEIEANNRAIDVLKSSGDTSEQVAEQIKKYEQANEELGKTLDFIGNTALPQATARAQAEQARADTEQTQTDIIEATKRYNDTLKGINADSVKDLLAIEQKRTDSLLAIAKKYADDSEQALKRLNDDIINARERFTDDEIKAREQALQAEADATRAHYNSIADISTQAKRDEQDALRNLDFKGAFEARRNRNRAIEDEQKKFVRDADERKINQDRERKERLNAYAKAQADAQDAYRREMDTARQNRDRALQEARASYQKEQAEARNAQAQKLRDLQTGYAQEIALARQTSAQRLAIQAQTDAQLLAQAQALLNSISRNRPAPSGSGRTTVSPPPNTGNRGGGGGKRNDRQVNINVNDSRNPRKTADVIRNMINNGNNKGSRR